MAKIKELPKIDRPREKALRYGINSLSDIELLALLLDKGYKGSNIIEVASLLLAKYGGIVGLLDVPVTELKKNKGIKNVGALKIALIGELYRRICIRRISSDEEIISAEYLYNKYRQSFYLSSQEQLILIIVNRKRRIIHEINLYKGNGDSILLDFKDIYKELVKYDGKYYYLVHNHPDGDCSPSNEDINRTAEIMFESKRMKLHLIDHLIIGDDGYYSFRKMKKIMISC